MSCCDDTHITPQIDAALAQSGVVYHFDTTTDPGTLPGNTAGTNTLQRRNAYSSVKRAELTIFVNRAGTVTYEEVLPGSTTWRVVTTFAVAASTGTICDRRTYGRDFRWYFTEGGVGAVTAMEANLRLDTTDHA